MTVFSPSQESISVGDNSVPSLLSNMNSTHDEKEIVW